MYSRFAFVVHTIGTNIQVIPRPLVFRKIDVRCFREFRETLEVYESPNAPRTIKTTVFKSCYTVKEILECYFNLATHTHTQNSTPWEQLYYSLSAVALQPVLYYSSR